MNLRYPERFKKVINWLGRYGAIVFVLAGYLAIVVILMIGGMNFFEAVQYSFQFVWHISDHRGLRDYPSLRLLSVIVILIVLVVIIFGGIKYKSKK